LALRGGAHGVALNEIWDVLMRREWKVELGWPTSSSATSRPRRQYSSEHPGLLAVQALLKREHRRGLALDHGALLPLRTVMKDRGFSCSSLPIQPYLPPSPPPLPKYGFVASKRGHWGDLLPGIFRQRDHYDFVRSQVDTDTSLVG